MTDIRIKILVFIKQGYLLSDVVRFGMGRGSAFVAVGIDQFFDHFIFFCLFIVSMTFLIMPTSLSRDSMLYLSC